MCVYTSIFMYLYIYLSKPTLANTDIDLIQELHADDLCLLFASLPGETGPCRLFLYINQKVYMQFLLFTVY